MAGGAHSPKAATLFYFMDQGWIKLHRKLKDKAFYSTDSAAVHLWIHLLIKANHKEREEMFAGKPIKCKPGQFTTGRKQLSQETGISESKISRLLKKFAKIEQQIEQQTSSTNRLISITCWDEYQSSEQQSEQQVNNERTTSEHTTRSKEYKELKKDTTRKLKFSEEDYRLSELLYNLMKQNNPNKTKPNLEKWAEEVRKMRELDNRSLIDIEILIRWSQQDEFWHTNILSTSKLRKQFDQLILKAKKEYNGTRTAIANDDHRI